MQRIPVRAATLALMLCALVCGPTDAQTVRPGGYTIGSETCGRGPFAFPVSASASATDTAREWLPAPRTGCSFRDRSFKFRAMPISSWPTWEVGFVPRADCCFSILRCRRDDEPSSARRHRLPVRPRDRSRQESL